MTRKLVALVAVVAAAIVVLVLYLRRDRRPKHAKYDTTRVHAVGIDRASSANAVTAMLTSPDAATPCETAFNAVEAGQQATKLSGGKPLFTWVAPKADFLAVCASLPPKTQSCMAPRYRRDHPECASLKPPEDVLKKMVIAPPEPPEPELP